MTCRAAAWPAMTMILVVSDTLPLSAVKARLSELVDRVAGQQDRVTITRNGRPAAVLVSADDLEGLEETLAVLADGDLVAQLRESQRDVEHGALTSLDDVRTELAARDA